jgi:beta-lactamase regulating signal transducer with metallopeptidase domain
MAMKKTYLSGFAATFLLVISLLAFTSMPTASAQNSSGQSGSAQQSNNQTTTTTTTTKPTEVTRTSTTTTVDPLWIVVGGVALVALLAILFLAMRGRGRDRVAVRESSTTVIKKD